MNLVESDQVIFTGGRFLKDGVMHADETTKFIERETSEYMTWLGVDNTGWNVLYRDNRDGRYWELFYRQSGLQGAGPPSLRLLSIEEVKVRFGHLLNAL